MTMAVRVRGRGVRRLCGALLAGVALSAPGFAGAQAQTPTPSAPAETAAVRSFAIPPQPLASALTAFGMAANLEVVYPAGMTGTARSPGVTGRFPATEALARLLAGTGFSYRMTGPTSVTLVELRTDGSVTLDPVMVRGAGAGPYGPDSGYTVRRSAAGTKTDTPILETPQSISVVTAPRIEAMGATNVKEALSYTPGIEIAPYGTDSRFDWVQLRGFDVYTPGFYLDGLQLRNIDTWSVWRVENYSAERIEVLRGPSSVLYGQSGPGGLVNVVSKRPTATPQGELRLQLGTDAHRQLAGDVSGPVDAEGRVLYRFIALLQDAELAAEGMPNDRVFVAPSVTLRPNDDTTLTLLAQYSKSWSGTLTRNAPEVGSLIATPAGTKVPSSTYNGEPDYNHVFQQQWSLGYLLEHRVNDAVTLRQNARYNHLDIDYRQVNGRNFIAVNGDETDPANYRTVRRSVFTSDETLGSLTIDNQAQFDQRFGRWSNRVLGGLDYQRTRVDQVTVSGGSVAPLDLYAPVYGSPVIPAAPYWDGRTTVSQLGVYLQDQLKFDERWVLTVGGRYDRARVQAVNEVDGTDIDDTVHRLTGRAGLVYLHPSGLAPYVSYSESFVPSAVVDPATGKLMEPETGRQYEAGLRYQPPGTDDTYGIAVFDLRRRNYVTYDLDAMPRQTGEVTVRGVELEAVVQPLPGLTLTAAYAWTPKADVTASSNPDEVGKQLNAVSKHRGSLWADYRLPGGLKFGAGVRYNGSNHGMGETTVAAVPSYTLFDAMIGYEFEDWNLALNARNLTDKEYIANCSYGSCYYGEQRTVMATVSRRW
ncbi:TonB-dependent siderophore receptor [Azospirillum sp. RWY-5-1]|uniref:TonB-dependent siderophore receptor n=1 Tax=Azospirillum oleiclasticum TaxID=2735135 RepID=A0ABX2T6I7_9PROT|nr:TonB-dependent siderophore receptor [Azospirillum oleiclasticum]NYZ12649.1 TonB-dependent siderophore receptor [Azospirillum oleiclasticum]NYZ19809.1 TonB-dependent siderophore receptor [Azospirillum oleiclasticum]